MAVKLTGPACRAGRALLGWSMRDLQKAGGVSLPTIQKIEAGGDFQFSTGDKIIAAFAAHGVQITNGSRPGARLKVIWRVDFAKAGGGFTAHPASGQPARMFPIFPTQERVRNWLASNGYLPLASDIDHWVFDGAPLDHWRLQSIPGAPGLVSATKQPFSTVSPTMTGPRAEIERWLIEDGNIQSPDDANVWYAERR